MEELIMRGITLSTMVLLSLGAASPALATNLAPNYTFPDGSQGFSLDMFLPAVQDTNLPAVQLIGGVLVGFNPQPDPPGTPPTLLSLDRTTNPLFGYLSNQPGSELILSFTGSLFPPGPCKVVTTGGIPPGPCVPPPTDGADTSFSFMTTDGRTVVVSLTIGGPGGVDPGSWVAFNPQPDPPGDVFGIGFEFNGNINLPTGALDPDLGLSITVDGNPVTFAAAPEPASLSILGAGLCALAVWRRRRRTA
jgi:hypothetical protein